MISFLRNLVFRDFLLKCFSLALAVLIWLTLSSVTLQNEVGRGAPLALALPERTFSSLPVMVMFFAQDVRNFRVTPTTVDVTVRADPKLLAGLQGKDLHVIVDLAGVEPGSNLRKRIDVYTPSGVLVASVEPADVEVIFPPKP